MQDIVKDQKLQMRGIVGVYAANSVGDDIEVYQDDSRTEVLCRLVSRIQYILFIMTALVTKGLVSILLLSKVLFQWQNLLMYPDIWSV